MNSSRAEQVARNNAAWCDAVCAAHGAPGQFHPGLWVNQNPVPRFYPNAVTLSGPEDAAAQEARIRDLVSGGLPGRWAVKDSFRALDLAELGFDVLFDASWLWLDPPQAVPRSVQQGVRWVWMKSGPELAEWEKAWNGPPPDDAVPSEPRLFLLPLLDRPDVGFLAAYRGETLVAGAAANRSGDVVGLSNLFTPPDDPLSFRVGCVQAFRERFPGSPVVGYERGPGLSSARAIGFEPVQELRVWLRREPAG